MERECIGCGEVFQYDINDIDSDRLLCRKCEQEDLGVGDVEDFGDNINIYID